MLQSVGCALSGKPVECPKKAKIEPLFVGMLEKALESLPVSRAPCFLIDVLPGDHPTLLLAELAQLQKLVFRVLALVLGGNPLRKERLS